MKKLLVLVSLVLMLGLVLTGCPNDTPVPTPATDKVNAVAPTFTNQLANTTYTINATATALNGTATVTDGGTISYQWYKSASNSTENGTAIDGATSANYIPPTDVLGTLYYYVIATNTIAVNKDGGVKIASATSNVAIITVNNKVNAVAPTFSGQLANTTYTINATATALNGTATVTDGGTISYQWYKSASNSTENGTAIVDATSATYTPPTTVADTFYYYVVATNTIADNKDGGIKTATATSNVATITVIYELGDTGPGGGTIFYADSTGAYREVSPVLQSSVDWTGAKTKAEDYTSNGYDDWYLPTPAELNQLKKSNSITENAALWSSEEWGHWGGTSGNPTALTNPAEAWVYNFDTAVRTHVLKTALSNSVRAVRSYSPKKYTNADIGKNGPGGGKIFWVDNDTGAYKEVSEKLGGDSERYTWYQASGTKDESNNATGAYIAGDYTGGGFYDWYLPSITELNDVSTNKTALSITDTSWYCSSSEYDSIYAWSQRFNEVYRDISKKTYTNGVRAIRAFTP